MRLDIWNLIVMHAPSNHTQVKKSFFSKEQHHSYKCKQIRWGQLLQLTYFAQNFTIYVSLCLQFEYSSGISKCTIRTLIKLANVPKRLDTMITFSVYRERNDQQFKCSKQTQLAPQQTYTNAERFRAFEQTYYPDSNVKSEKQPCNHCMCTPRAKTNSFEARRYKGTHTANPIVVSAICMQITEKTIVISFSHANQVINRCFLKHNMHTPIS